MRRQVSPARQAWRKRRAKVFMPWIVAGALLLGWGLLGGMVARLLHQSFYWALVGLGVEFAGLIIMFVGVWRVLRWERTAPFEEQQT